ncbi:MBL fold metallo-hydrolase [Pseudarthrobacter raffinosi]|uniref:MBL fold metallo-hydrolase n=1 Tax=Pseudarthrobacter raffinosi TaxID=2953651 RepID=UPI00208F0ABE|nr:MBL fold metallo-hydrolase [Pseudarthrobacter sp. MDT3-9]MCO4252124.1 MBL fold metallo-hydrolase [Pseudarthrobacter sp. MDT3-9]
MNTQYDWDGIQRGQHIVLEDPRGNRQTAVIDDYTEDGEILWVRGTQNDRRLLCREDGYKLIAATWDEQSIEKLMQTRDCTNDTNNGGTGEMRCAPFASRVGAVLVVALLIVLSGCSQLPDTRPSAQTDAVERGRDRTARGQIQIQQFTNSEGFSSWLYVVSVEDKTIVIDPGFYSDAVSEYLERVGGADAVLLTHGHWDHLAGLDALKAEYPDAQVFLPAPDAEFPTNPDLNQSKTAGFELNIQSPIIPLDEGTHEIAGYSIVVTHTPGHTVGSSLYYFTDYNALFTGDTILADSVGPTFRPTGSEKDMQSSIDMFLAMSFDADLLVFPGHGQTTTYRRLIETNQELQARSRAVD